MDQKVDFSVTAGPGVPAAHATFAQESKIYQNWRDSLDPRFGVSAVTVQAVDFRGKPSVEMVMFVRLRVKASNAPFEQIVELRGGTVVILLKLRCGGIDYTVLVGQPRLATGSYQLLEVPAGMIDGGTFAGAVAKELKQELDLVFSEHELVEMTEGEGIYLSPGLLDESAAFYLARREVTAQELADLQGKATGVAEEGEKITLKVIKFSDLPRATRDGKTFIALALYARLGAH